MFITTRKYFMSGNGGLESKEMLIDMDDISSVTECGYESRPYTGLTKVSMKNGDNFYASINIEDLKRQQEEKDE